MINNVISGNFQSGVQVLAATATGTVVQGNLIGTDFTGMAAIPNSGSGVEIGSSASNTLVGTNADGVNDVAERNVISANGFYGVEINGPAEQNVVAGNFLGTNVLGTSALGNDFGVWIFDAPNNIIGGSTAAARNVISGNHREGIRISLSNATNNKIFGNYIGLDSSGTSAIPNLSRGVLIRPGVAGNFLGTDGDGVDDALEGNVIAGQLMDIEIDATAGANVIAGNLVGTDATGLVSLSGSGERVFIGSPSNRIGTNADGISDAEERNVFAGGVQIAGDLSTFAGNLVGIGPDESTLVGTPDLIVTGTSPTIGGQATAQRNYFANTVDFQGAFFGTFQNNYVGVLPDGVTANVSSQLRLSAGAQSNVIGGVQANAGNLIARVLITDAGTASNVIDGNLIGANADGSDGLGTNANVVLIENGASFNTIGTPSRGNVISSVNSASIVGADMHGLVIRGTGTDDNQVQHNRIGLNEHGDVVIGNNIGIWISDGAARTIIGGPAAGEGNVISGNVLGVRVDGAVDTEVRGNLIGTDIDGELDLGNRGQGVLDTGGSSGTIISGNVVSGNDGGGIQLGDGSAAGSASDATIIGNMIGTDIDGTTATGNAGFGIKIAGASSITVGGAAKRDLWERGTGGHC